MAVRTLPLDFEDAHYFLVGIHSSIEPYQLAFVLNTALEICLHRAAEDVTKTPEECFCVFEHEDIISQQSWQLFSNKTFQRSGVDASKSLFDQSPIVSYLIPEKKEVDSFLKFSSGKITMANCLEILRKIPQISACYELNMSCLKSKNNLIFG